MKYLLDFSIEALGPISIEFLNQGIQTFHEACRFVQNLPYRRNTNKDNLTVVFTDQCGTCSTKHALLKQLCMEHEMHEVKLLIGIFKMNRENTPQTRDTLTKFNLYYIPEAHTYLRYQDQYFDFTKTGSSPAGFVDDLMLEKEILPHQINKDKIQLHQDFLKKWLDQTSSIDLSFNEIWSIREQCIVDLSL